MIKELSLLDVKTAVDVSFPEIEKFDYLPTSDKKAPSAYLSIMEGCSKSIVHFAWCPTLGVRK